MTPISPVPDLPPGLGEEEPAVLGAGHVPIPPPDFTIPLPWPNDRIYALLDEEVLLPDGRIIPAGETVHSRVEAALLARWHAGGFWIYLVKIAGVARRIPSAIDKGHLDPATAWVHEHTIGSPTTRPSWERIPDVDAPARPTG